MKESRKQNDNDKSEDTTIQNSGAEPCKPASDLNSSEQIKKLPKSNKPKVVSAKDSGENPLNEPYSQGL